MPDRMRRFAVVSIVFAALASIPATPAASGPLPDWVKELVAPSDGNQDHVVGEDLC